MQLSRANYESRRCCSSGIRWRPTTIANGILEGINSLVQAAKAQARGYALPAT
jgi:hypothetical protein